MGRVILRNNIVDGVNTLTQAMISQANTIYVIQYDFDLGSTQANPVTVTIPDNCILEFEGGSLNNGTVVLSDTIIEGTKYHGTATFLGNSKGNLNSDILNINAAGFAKEIKDNKVSIIDLNGLEIDDFENKTYGLPRNNDIIIKNGILVLNDNMRINFAALENLGKVRFENIHVIANGSDSAFIMTSDTGSFSNPLEFVNCKFENQGNSYCRIVFGNIKSIKCSNCYFLNCGITVTSHWVVDGFIADNIYIYDNCLFEYKGEISFAENADCISCGTAENLIVNGCTFNNIPFSCIDVYPNNRGIITNNKFIHCSNCIELKVIFRSEEYWEDGRGNGEYDLKDSFIISGNIFVNIQGSGIHFPLIMTGDTAYIEDKIETKTPISIIISENAFVYDDTSASNTNKYAILGNGFRFINIVNNTFYSVSNSFLFYRSNISYYKEELVQACVNIAHNSLKTIGAKDEGLISVRSVDTTIINSNIFNITNAPSGQNNFAVTVVQATKSETTLNASNNLGLSVGIFSASGSTEVTYLNIDNCNGFIEHDETVSKVVSVVRNSKNIDILNKSNVLKVHAFFNSEGVSWSQNISYPTTNVCDRNSYIRLSSYDYRKNYLANKERPFDTVSDLFNLGVPICNNYVYIKNDIVYRFVIGNAADVTGWFTDDGVSDNLLFSGSTEERTTMTASYKSYMRVGFRYFDTTLGKPVYVSSISGSTVTWVDATGVTV